MMTKTRKLINTTADRRLADLIGFRGKYVDSLFAAARRHYKIKDASDAKAILAEIDRRKAAEVKAKWGISLREYRRLREKARQILADFSTGYSMGEWKTIEIGEEIFLRVDNTREYANSSRYKAMHGDLKIRIDLLSLRKIERIQGVWTIRRAGNRASWLQSEGTKNRYTLRWVQGYLVGTSHGATLAECQALEGGKAIRTEEGAVKRLDRFVGLRDRITAGACEAGVLAFCERHNLDPTLGYRLDYLLGLGDPIATSYINRLASKLQRA